ncbi:MAG TPA: Na+/H+ antiporter subunit G [Chiayiivirga sp.]|nr:Na+/H+ antiporter subunit G [Chiayiivirga sp.]
MSVVVEILIAAMLLTSSFFIVLGSLGLLRFRDFFQRLHAPTKATTLGVGCLLIASIFYHPLISGHSPPRELLITLFLFITAPISAHMMAKAAISLHLARSESPSSDAPALDDAGPPAPPHDETEASSSPEPAD